MTEAQRQAVPGDDQTYDREMTLVEHLAEFRTRLVRAVIALTLASIVAFFFWERIFNWLAEPKGQHELIYLRPQDMMLSVFRVSLIGGVVISMPILVYQLIMFLLPALTHKERKYLYFIVPGATVSFLIGVIFSRYILLPAALNFLLNFGANVARPELNIGDYISFVFTLLIWVGVAFETPLIIYFLAKLKVVNTKMLTKFRRFAVLGAFIIAAVITPTPDPYNQALVAVPLLLLYEIGVLLSRIA
jgi:sec-independent protein translocase protein TatC